VPFFKVRGDEETSAKGELTSYELDQLKVTAVIRTSLGAVSASLESRDGRSFIIRPGTKIGVRGGIVEEITDAGVVVVREVSGIDGVTVARRELGIR
jgi:Tfp pilus assembly protein PilP